MDMPFDTLPPEGRAAAAGAGAGPTDIREFTISGMTCGSCVGRVERALEGLPGVASASVNLATALARVNLTQPLADADLQSAIAAAGYGAEPVISGERETSQADHDQARAEKRDLLVLAVAVTLTLPLVGQMAFPLLGINVGLPPLLQLLLATPIQFWAGAAFYRHAWPALKAGTGNMDLLVALGTSAAYGLSTALALSSGSAMLSWQDVPHLYFEASAAVITLVLLGRFIEERAKRRTSQAIRALLALRPETAWVDRCGKIESIPVDQLELGDLLVIKPGERIAADGTVVKGESAVDESLLTGESLPVDKSLGSKVTGGSLNGNGLLRVKVEALGEDSRLSRIVALVRDAQASKPPVQKLVDRVSAVFVPLVVAVAGVTLAGWLLAGIPVSEAIIHAVTVLVIACPCALGLATPTALMVGTGLAARRGILIKDASALEQAREIGMVVFDKTGTLTLGQPELTDLEPAPGTENPGFERNELLRLAASAQSGSEHPLARAVLESAAAQGIALTPPESFEGLPGRGLRAAVEGRALLLGSARLMAEHAVGLTPLEAKARGLEAAGRTVTWVAEGGTLLGLLAFGDRVRPGAREAIADLKRMGLETALLTGDNRRAAEQVASELGIGRVLAEVLPEDKAAEIEGLRATGAGVAMVGDGVNDAPALASADLGIAMAGGSDVAVESAMVTLVRDDPRLVPEAVVISRRTLAKIRQNLFWAFIYNTLGIPMAAFGVLSPVFAGAAMALSSISVVGNSLLLSRHDPGKETVR